MQKHATCPAKKGTTLSATRGAGLVQIANALIDHVGYFRICRLHIGDLDFIDQPQSVAFNRALSSLDEEP